MSADRFEDAGKGGSDALVGGRWRLGPVLGRGGMATVYAATHRNGSRVAIKILHADVARDADALARFIKEGYLGNSVEHAGAVQTLDDGVLDDGRPFLVMERLDGETLVARLERSPTGLAVDEVVPIARAVLDTLAAAHARGIIHRDVKPENMFLTRDGRTKLLDFGIARGAAVGSTDTVTGMAMGTPAYMPPEQARGRWDLVDRRSDLWAVGAVLVHVLTGRSLRHDGTPAEQLLQAMSPCPRMASFAPRLPAALAAFLDRAVSFEAADRFQSADEMSRALIAAAALSRASPTTSRPSPLTLPRALTISQFLPPIASTRVVVAAAAAISVTSLMLLVVALTGSAPPVRHALALPPVPVSPVPAGTNGVSPIERRDEDPAAPPSTPRFTGFSLPPLPSVFPPTARRPAEVPSASSRPGRTDPLDRRF